MTDIGSRRNVLLDALLRHLLSGGQHHKKEQKGSEYQRRPDRPKAETTFLVRLGQKIARSRAEPPWPELLVRRTAAGRKPDSTRAG